MKIFLFSTTFISLIFAIFYCNNALDPHQISISDFISNNESSRDLPLENSLTRSSDNRHFTWQPVKTAVIPLGKSLNLDGSASSANSGDISWTADKGTFAALKPMKVRFYKLGPVDMENVTTRYLNTLNFDSNSISAAPVSSPSNPNDLPVNTVIACKTPDGKYYLLEIAKVNWGMYWDVQLSVYQGTYVTAQVNQFN